VTHPTGVVNHLDMPVAKKNQPAKQDTKPNLPWVSIIQDAIKAQSLATDNQAALGSRLSTAFLSQFASDVTGLGVAVPAAMTAHTGAVQLTAAQALALETGANLVMGVRTSVKGQSPPVAVQAAYTVGSPVHRKLVKSVRSALDTIGKRIAAQPTEADGFGITTDDATAIAAAISAIDAADQAQEAARATAPKTTKDRNAMARRLIAGTRLIAGAGMRVFASNPTLHANFAALVKKAA
jgi:hypothetical protein